MISPALQVRNVHAGYGEIDVVRGIDIDVGHGEAVGLFGPNGHGKTTLFRVISGLVSARRGEIVAFGTDITNAGPRKVVAPHYDFNDDALPVGTQYWVTLVEEFLKAQPGGGSPLSPS